MLPLISNRNNLKDLLSVFRTLAPEQSSHVKFVVQPGESELWFSYVGTSEMAPFKCLLCDDKLCKRHLTSSLAITPYLLKARPLSQLLGRPSHNKKFRYLGPVG